MARFASLALLGAAVVSAHPSHNHAHKHRAVEQARNIGDVIVATIDGVEVSWTQESNYWGGAAATPTPAVTPTPAAAVKNVNVNVAAAVATTAPAAAAKTTTDSSTTDTTATTDTTGYTVSEYTAFADLACKTTSKRATLAEIAQVGNIGSSDCYGNNMVVVTDSAVAEQYENTVSFSGAAEDMTCTYWNKIAKDGTIAGWYKDADSYYTFTLAAGETVYLAADNGTAGGASCFPASTGIEFDTYGAIGGTWLEYTFVDVTTGYSGWDASCIIAEDGGLTINGLEVCADDGTQCSSIGADLSSISAAFNSALAAADGLGGQCEGPVKLAGNFGF